MRAPRYKSGDKSYTPPYYQRASLPAGAITLSIGESQAVQSEAIAAIEKYVATISESQATQIEAIGATESYTAAISESQTVQTEAIIATEKYTASIVETQAAQIEAVNGTVSSGVNADIAETQPSQIEAITAIVPVVPPIIIPLPIPMAGNGNRSSRFTHRRGRPMPATRKKQLQLAFEDTDRLRRLAEEEAEEKRRELAQLLALVQPRVHSPIRPRLPSLAAASAHRAIAHIRPIIAERERQAKEHAKREQEIEDLIMMDIT